MNAVPVKMLSCDLIIFGFTGSKSSQCGAQVGAQAAAYHHTPTQYQSGCRIHVPILGVVQA